MTPTELTSNIMQKFRMYEEIDLYKSEWKSILDLIEQVKSEWCKEQRKICADPGYEPTNMEIFIKRDYIIHAPEPK